MKLFKADDLALFIFDHRTKQINFFGLGNKLLFQAEILMLQATQLLEGFSGKLLPLCRSIIWARYHGDGEDFLVLKNMCSTLKERTSL